MGLLLLLEVEDTRPFKSVTSAGLRRTFARLFMLTALRYQRVTDDAAWTGLSTGARCDYDNDATNVTTYGRLYNWYAATDARACVRADGMSRPMGNGQT